MWWREIADNEGWWKFEWNGYKKNDNDEEVDDIRWTRGMDKKWIMKMGERVEDWDGAQWIKRRLMKIDKESG